MERWVLSFLCSLAGIFILDFFFSRIFKDKKQFKYDLLSILLKLFLALVCAFLPLGGPKFLRPIQEILIALYVVLLSEALNGIIFLVFRKRKFLTKRLFSLAIALSFFLYGTINSQVIKENEHYIYTDKVSDNYSFIFMSDLHVGTQDLKNVKKKIDEIKKYDIDFLVLGGDITDDYTTKSEMIEFYSYFKDFSYPVYFIYGNHDFELNTSYRTTEPYTEDELLNAIESNNIIILKDEYQIVNNDLVIFGRDDKTNNSNRLSEDEINIDSSIYTIVFDHETPKVNGTGLTNADLQVSGHTHSGQFFPFRYLYDLFISPAYGEYSYQISTLIVSSGFSGWRVPFKTEGHAEYDLIHINKK